MRPVPPRLAALLSAALLASALPLASAQPFVADGGFGKPLLVAGAGALPMVALTLSEDGARVVWANSFGIWSADPYAPGSAEQLVEARSVRGIWATSVAGEMAIAWLERNMTTGSTRHMFRFKGRTSLIFEANLEIALVLGQSQGRPWLLAAPRAGGRAVVQLYASDADGSLAEPLVLHSTNLLLRGLSGDLSYNGDALDGWVAWLEGRVSETPLGIDSEWRAYLLEVPGPEAAASPLELGRADVSDQRQATAVAAFERPAVLWPSEAGNLRLSTLSAGNLSHSDLGQGRALAMAADGAYWLAGDAVRRTSLGEAPARTVNVAWSPVIISGAVLATGPQAGQAGTIATASANASATTADTATSALAWQGRRQGGAVELYYSDTSAPFTPGLMDRLAAAMRWSPWTTWEEATGQFLTALLVGVLVTLAMTPLLYLVSAVAARVRGLSRAALRTGVIIGLLPLTLVAVLLLWGGAIGANGAGAELLTVLFCLALGALLAVVANRGRDREVQMTILLTAGFASFSSIATWSFVNYPRWAPLFGLA